MPMDFFQDGNESKISIETPTQNRVFVPNASLVSLDFKKGRGFKYLDFNFLAFGNSMLSQNSMDFVKANKKKLNQNEDLNNFVSSLLGKNTGDK